MNVPVMTGVIRRRILLNYRVDPEVVQAQLPTAFFDDRALFPAASIQLDHALLMRDVPHEWHAQPTLRN